MSTSSQDMQNIISGAQGTVSGLQQGSQGNNLGYLRSILGAGRLASGVLGQSGPTNSALGDAGLGLGVAQGVSSGTPMGYANAAVNAGNLANHLGAFGDNSSAATSGLSGAGGALGLAGGLERGGAAGDAQAALGGAQLASSAGAMAGSTALTAASQYIPVLGTLLGAYLSTQTPAVELDPKYWNNYTKTLQNDIDSGNKGQFAADTMGLMSSDNKTGIPPNIQQMINNSGIHYPKMTPELEQKAQQVLQQAGPHATGRGNPDKLYATGGNVNHYSLHDILQGPTMHERAEAGPHMSLGGYYSYENSYPGDPGNGDPYGSQISGDYQFSSGEPGYGTNPIDWNSQLTANGPGTTLDNPYLSQNALLSPGEQIANQTAGNTTNIQGLGGGASNSPSGSSSLGSLLSNPSLLGALLGGGLGLAGALGSKNGASDMTANYKPTPPPMFQGSGPNPAGNMYGSVSATPRQRLNPTNIDYAHAGEQPTPGGNMFYSSSAGAPTAPQSNTSPLQQYGAQAPATPNAQTGGINPATLQQLLAALGGQSSTATQGMGTMPRPMWSAHGGPIHGYSGMAMGSPYEVSASQGGPRHIKGPGDGTSDSIDAKLSSGEFVMDAGTVSMLGNGDNEAGARKLEELRTRLRRHAGEKLVKGEQFMKASSPMSYMSGSKK